MEEFKEEFSFDVSELCATEITVFDNAAAPTISSISKSEKVESDTTKKTKIKKESEQIRCDQCPKTFTQKRLLYNHLRNVHIEGRPFVCPTCAKGFKTQHSLNEHMETHNPNREVFPCDMCSKTYQIKGSLINHMRKHKNEYVTKCEVCSQQFVSVKDLKSHLKTKHSESFLCTYCGKIFASSYSLNYHMQKHDPSFRKGNMKCDFCHQAFDTWRVKRDHMRLRHGDVERVHACDLCGKRFLRQNALQWHMNTHTGEKPYKCNFCSRAFTEPKSLQRHAFSAHQVTRAFVCSVCEEAFKSEALMSEHVKAAHDSSQGDEK